MRERSDMMKTSTPIQERRALIRGSAVSTMRKDDEYLRNHHSAKKTDANPCSETILSSTMRRIRKRVFVQKNTTIGLCSELMRLEVSGKVYKPREKQYIGRCIRSAKFHYTSYLRWQ